ncbi:polysaccharide biosynthesis/export family protein [Oleomonas cavernae]|nr:polysaccharide biosynthesis/export family protein [Oleomonas cavernae]
MMAVMSAPVRRFLAGLALAVAVGAGPAAAQSLITGGPAAPDPTAAPSTAAVSTTAPSLADRPFGAGLFINRQAAAPVGGGNPQYKVQPGDQVQVHLFGAVQQDLVQTVDPQGNIFIPQVGPVSVKGVPAGQLTSAIQEQVRKSYPSDTVQVYSTIIDARAVGVFVTGFVAQPGRHMGSPADSVLDYLVRAGGILEGAGSYRDVTIKRDGGTVAKADLYDFLLDGDLPPLTLGEGDTIVVGGQHPVVKAGGEVRNEAVFEFAGKQMSGAELVTLARPLPSVNNVFVTGTRNGIPSTKYLTLQEFKSFALSDQDIVEFQQDSMSPVIAVHLEGSYEGQSTYVVSKSTTLRQLLEHIPIDPRVANFGAVHLRRTTVAEQQKKALDSALDRLQRSVLTAVVETSGEAALRSAEAQMVLSFIDRVRGAKPDGTLVVSDDQGRVADIPLENEDIVVIPKVSSTVLIAGEVLAPQTLVWKPGVTAEEYVAQAGSYTDRAERGRFLVQKPNGAILLIPDPTVQAGDQIVVLPEMAFKGFQFIQDLADVIFRVAGITRFLDN